MVCVLCACGGDTGDEASAKFVPAEPVSGERLLASFALSSSDAVAVSARTVALLPDFTNGTSAFADCFSYVPGTRFDMSDGTKWLIVAEGFQGQAAFGAAQLREDGTRVGTQYYAIESGYFRLLGDSAEDLAGELRSTSAYFSDYRIPLRLSPGASVHFNGVSTTENTRASSDDVVDITSSQQRSKITYLGQETLQLGGHTFTQACKLLSVGYSVDSLDADEHRGWANVLWFASGYGVIQSEDIDEQGRAVPGSLHQLVKIITSP